METTKNEVKQSEKRQKIFKFYFLKSSRIGNENDIVQCLKTFCIERNFRAFIFSVFERKNKTFLK